MAKKPALARGLDSIFSDNTPSDGGSGGVLKLRISDVEPKSDQPRKDFDPEALSQLADSIAANGVLQNQISQNAQNAFITQALANQTAALSPTPIPAYVVQNPNCYGSCAGCGSY